MPDKKYDVVKTERSELGRFAIRLDTVRDRGKEYPYSYIEAKDSCAVLAEAEGKIILVRQYRHSVGEYLLEIPGGSLEHGESPYKAARREFFEETGYKVQSMIPLGNYYPTVGSSYEKCFLFYAKCTGFEKQELEPLEYLEVKLVEPSELEEMIGNGEFVHGMGLVAWLKYKMMAGHG